MSEANHFIELAKIDVSKHIEKKQNLSYLSWAWAIDQLMRVDPSANWVFQEPTMFGETMMVSCTVTAFGKPITMHLPVMDHRNQAIKNPDAFQVNKNMMRCLVKAIACHGLGLYIYAGEDLPSEDDKPPVDGESIYIELNKHAAKGGQALDAAIKKLSRDEMAALTPHMRKALRDAATLMDSEIANQA